MANQTLAEYWASLEKERGLPAGYLSKTRHIESRGDPTAVSPTGAVGPFQFTRGTARAMQLPLEARTDEFASARAAADLAAQNKSILQKALGRDPADYELYLAHNQGGGTAAKILQNPDLPAGAFAPPTNLTVNGGDPNAPGAGFIDKWRAKFAGGPMSDANTIKGSSTPLDASRFTPNYPQGTNLPPPVTPAPPVGRGQGLYGLLSSDQPLSSQKVMNFMGGPEMTAATKGFGMLASAMAQPAARPAPPPMPVADANVPDMSLLQLIKRKQGMI